MYYLVIIVFGITLRILLNGNDTQDMYISLCKDYKPHLHALQFLIEFSPQYIEVAVCQPYITGPTPVICPDSNETFVFTCRDSQVFYITWSVRPDYGIFSERDRMLFAVIDGTGRTDRRPPFTGILIGVFNISNTPSNQPIADLVSTLTVFNKNISDRTVVTCTTLQRNTSMLRSQITLIIAGVVHVDICCISQNGLVFHLLHVVVMFYCITLEPT